MEEILMAKMKFKTYIFSIPRFSFLTLTLLIGILLSCTRDEVVPYPEIPNEIQSINNFIWENMDYYYLWRNHMPSNIDPEKQPDPAQYFHDLLFTPDDRWSFITNDYHALVDRLQGISKMYGHEFKLFREEGSKQVFGIIEYVVKNSPAESEGIKRGDIFNRINGILLDTLNFRSLLFSNESYTIGFADLIDDKIVSNDNEIFLSPIVMQEDPILLDTVYSLEGRQIGYIVYNQFISSLNSDLTDVFTYFKAKEVSDLIIDLRYNPGGSVGTATLLASLVAPSNVAGNEEVFIKYKWNDILDQYWREKEGDDSNNLIIKFLNVEQNINMERLYVLTSSGTASASELIINGLKPYMDVILVGDTTHGKYTASITLHDEEKSFDWAIQPIVLKTTNIYDETDFKDGFFPNYYIEDDYLSPLGSLEEDRLAYAISLITGVPPGLPARKSFSELLPHSIPLISGGSTNREDKIILNADNVLDR